MTLSQDPVTYAVPFFVLFILAEYCLARHRGEAWFETKDSAASLAMGIGVVFFNLFVKAVTLGFYSFFYQFRLFDIEWAWWSWLLLLFADDFTFYWHHRLSHEVRILWAAHVNHHSSQKYNFTTALRQSWTEEFYKFLWWFWLPLLGFHPVMVMMMQSISLIYQFLMHTHSVQQLGFLEYFMSTPSHHRVHHGSNIAYLDRNHAGIFIIWDKIFGTFEPENPKNPVVYGLTNNIHTYNPFHIATHEFVALWHDMKDAPTYKDALLYAIMPPGWKPNGEGMTAKDLQNLQKMNKE